MSIQKILTRAFAALGGTGVAKKRCAATAKNIVAKRRCAVTAKN
jgi:hypothetical protein